MSLGMIIMLENSAVVLDVLIGGRESEMAQRSPMHGIISVKGDSGVETGVFENLSASFSQEQGVFISKHVKNQVSIPDIGFREGLCVCATDAHYTVSISRSISMDGYLI